MNNNKIKSTLQTQWTEFIQQQQVNKQNSNEQFTNKQATWSKQHYIDYQTTKAKRIARSSKLSLAENTTAAEKQAKRLLEETT